MQALAAIAAMTISMAARADDTARVAPPPDLAAHVAQLREADAVAGDEARCLAHPDLPYNTWRPGAAAARCALLRAPPFPLDAIAQRLASEGGAADLDRDFSALLDAHYADPAQREQVFHALSAFDASTRAREVSDRWLSLAPDSAFALVASATHHGAVAREARGVTAMSAVPDASRATMAESQTAAVPLHARALELNPRLVPACVGLLDIGRQASRDMAMAMKPVCLAMDPDGYHVNWALVLLAQPRWGGSATELAEVVARADAGAARNPMLGALVAEADADATTMRDGRLVPVGEIAVPLAALAKRAPNGTLIGEAGEAFVRIGDRWQAVVHLSQALRYWPHKEAPRARRAYLLADLGDLEWAERDLAKAIAVDGTIGWRHHRMALLQQQLGRGHAAMRPHLQRALADPQSRREAFVLLCSGYLQDDMPAEAESCTGAMTEAYPEDGEAWFLREAVLTRTGGDGLDRARTALDFHGDSRDPRHAARMAELRAMRVGAPRVSPESAPRP